MRYTDFLATWQGTQAANRALGLAVVALAAAVGVLAWLALARERVIVLVPPELEHRLEVARNSGSADYKRAWAMYLAQMLGNVTPASVDFVRKAVEPLLASSIFHAALGVMEVQAAQIKRDRVALRFEARKVVYEPESELVFVSGFAIAESASGTEDRRPRTYEIQVQVSAYAPQITHLQVYDGEPKLGRQRTAREGEKRS